MYGCEKTQQSLARRFATLQFWDDAVTPAFYIFFLNFCFLSDVFSVVHSHWNTANEVTEKHRFKAVSRVHLYTGSFKCSRQLKWHSMCMLHSFQLLSAAYFIVLSGQIWETLFMMKRKAACFCRASIFKICVFLNYDITSVTNLSQG